MRKTLEHIRRRAQEDKATNTILWAFLRILSRLGNEFFMIIWSLMFKWVPTPLGRLWRRLFLRLVLKRCGKGIMVSVGVHLEYPRRIEIGDRVWIGRGCHIEGMGGILIGNYTLIALQSVLQSGGHEIVPGELYLYSRVVHAPIVIGDNAWLGARTMVRYGINIGENSVAGMGAVIVKDVPPNTIVGGVPARTIRTI